LLTRNESPCAIFTKLGVGEGVPDPHAHAKFHRCGKNIDLQRQYLHAALRTGLPVTKIHE